MAPRTGGSVLIFVVLVAVIMCFVPSTRADGSIESLINSINSTVSGNASANATLTAVGGLLNQFLAFNTSSLSQAEILQLQSAIADLVSDLLSQPLAADASNVADIVGVLDDATSNPALLSVDLVNSIVSFLLTSPNPPVFTETYVTDLLDLVSALLTGPSSRRRTSNLVTSQALLTLQNKLLVSIAGFANANLACGDPAFTYTTSTYSVIADAIYANQIASQLIYLPIGNGDAPVTFTTGDGFATPIIGCIFYVYFNENFDPFPSNSSLYSTISDIGTLSFYDSDGNYLPFSNLPAYGLVTVSLPVSGDDATNAEVVCVFYDYNLGDWSSAGCSKDTGSTTTSVLVCDCDHLTTFAAGLSSTVIYDSAYQLTGETVVNSDVTTSAKNCLGYDPSLNATLTGFKASIGSPTATDVCCSTLGYYDGTSCSLPRCNAAATTENNYVRTLTDGTVPQACLVNCFQSSSTVPAVTFFNGAKVLTGSGGNAIPTSFPIPTARTVFATSSTGVVNSAYFIELTQTRRRGLQRRSLTGSFGCIGKGSVVGSPLTSAECVVEGCNTQYTYTDYFFDNTGTSSNPACFVDCYAKN